MKCIVTRDKDGCICFWEKSALRKLRINIKGMWQNKGHKNPANGVLVVASCSSLEVCKLLSFTPRKSSKQLVDIKVAKCKS